MPRGHTSGKKTCILATLATLATLTAHRGTDSWPSRLARVRDACREHPSKTAAALEAAVAYMPPRRGPSGALLLPTASLGARRGGAARTQLGSASEDTGASSSPRRGDSPLAGPIGTGSDEWTGSGSRETAGLGRRGRSSEFEDDSAADSGLASAREPASDHVSRPGVPRVPSRHHGQFADSLPRRTRGRPIRLGFPRHGGRCIDDRVVALAPTVFRGKKPSIRVRQPAPCSRAHASRASTVTTVAATTTISTVTTVTTVTTVATVSRQRHASGIPGEATAEGPCSRPRGYRSRLEKDSRRSAPSPPVARACASLHLARGGWASTIIGRTLESLDRPRSPEQVNLIRMLWLQEKDARLAAEAKARFGRFPTPRRLRDTRPIALRERWPRPG